MKDGPEFEARYQEWLNHEEDWHHPQEPPDETFDDFMHNYLRENMGRLFADPDISHEPWAIAISSQIMLSSMMNEPRPDVTTLAKWCSLSLEVAQTALDKLEESGWPISRLDINHAWDA